MASKGEEGLVAYVCWVELNTDREVVRGEGVEQREMES